MQIADIRGQMQVRLTNTKRLSPFTLNALHVKVDNTGTVLIACYDTPGTDVNRSDLTTKHDLMYLIVQMCELFLTKLVSSFEIQICQY